MADKHRCFSPCLRPLFLLILVLGTVVLVHRNWDLKSELSQAREKRRALKAELNQAKDKLLRTELDLESTDLEVATCTKELSELQPLIQDGSNDESFEQKKVKQQAMKEALQQDLTELKKKCQDVELGENE